MEHGSSKVSTRLAREIVRAIMSNELPPGTMLMAEPELARQHQVGRSTVREALRLLEVWGAVEMRQGRSGGARTRRPEASVVGESLWIAMQFNGVSLGELFETRRTFDMMLARLAAERMTTDDVLELALAVRGLGDHLDDLDGYHVYNDYFHQVLAGACGNKALQVLVEISSSLTTDLTYELGNPIEWRRQSVQLRQLVFRAIAGGRPAEAEHQMGVYRDAMMAWWSEHFPDEVARPVDVLRDDRLLAPTVREPRSFDGLCGRSRFTELEGALAPNREAGRGRSGDKPAPKASLRVARSIARDILDGALEEGSTLPPENELAARYTVGRSTVREALRLLEVWGAIDVRTGRSSAARVRRPDAQVAGAVLAIVMQSYGVTLAELFHTRKIFDVMMARLAAQHMETPELLMLADAVRGLREHLDDKDMYFVYNDRFYELLAASGNRALRVLLDSIKSLTVNLMYQLGNPVEWRRESVVLRNGIFRAISSANPDEAERAMALYRDTMFAWWTARFPDEMSRPIDVLGDEQAVAPTSKDVELFTALPRPLRSGRRAPALDGLDRAVGHASG